MLVFLLKKMLVLRKIFKLKIKELRRGVHFFIAIYVCVYNLKRIVESFLT
jgi:hypothetical protein